ncbi:helix-turn-helix transcriptional regulator [Tomitella biformata]|uniref:helix-turn-helix transcriptional regulator n=1 Tax=Tomitella biformata TaxID=630403 RepID=UPI0004676A5E|nr:helix-turn-helix domain-containing protein [Tomitella biformata]
MDRTEALGLGVTTDLQTAARALGIGKSTAYALAQKGEFPVRVIRMGSRYVIPTRELLDLLGVEAA